MIEKKNVYICVLVKGLLCSFVLWPQSIGNTKEGEKTYANLVHCQTERVMSESVPTTNLVYTYIISIINIIYNNKRFSRAGRGVKWRVTCIGMFILFPAVRAITRVSITSVDISICVYSENWNGKTTIPPPHARECCNRCSPLGSCFLFLKYMGQDYIALQQH